MLKLLALALAVGGIMLWTAGHRHGGGLTDYGRRARVHTMEIATFGAGCFWGVEAAFRRVPGVVSTRVGYTGGTVEHPTYEQVCAGHTGHTEAVEVTFDPSKVTYEQLLDVFWQQHDPAEPAKTQYKSVIFTHNDAQRAAAEAAVSRLRAAGRRVVTEIRPAPTFWPAEDYHQQFYEKRGITADVCPR